MFLYNITLSIILLIILLILSLILIKTNKPSGLLSKDDIKKAIKSGKIIAKPIEDKQIGTESIDVRLGQWVAVPEQDYTNGEVPTIYPSDLIFSSLTLLNEPHLRDKKRHTNYKWYDISKPVQIAPGTKFLAYTEEFIGTTANSGLHPEFHQRSTPARHFLFHTKAGWGDQGFFNRWCMEFIALDYITIQHLDRVGQISFVTTTNKANYTSKGNYQSSSKLIEIMQNWKKEDILPKKSLK